MNCQETQKLIHGYVDGELDLVSSLQIEQHVHECRSCAQEQANIQALQGALRGGGLYFQAPSALRKRVQSAVAQSGPSSATPWPRRWPWLGAALALVATVLVTWGLARGLTQASAEDALAQQVVASHVRSLMPNHLTDVASSDQHTVKPWFSGKLDFSPLVVDLSDQGDPLIGGRLDYLDGRPVAALVYRHTPHLINLFIWPSATAASVKTEVLQGYQVVHWTQSGMTYWAISDLNAAELQVFVQLVQQHASP